MPVLRTWGLALAALAVWFLSVYAQTPPPALGPDAPATQFSAARAMATLARLQGPARPHPAGTGENEAIHARLEKELAALGVKVRHLSDASCYGGARWNAIACAQIDDLIGEAVPGQGKAILLMAHMDSVPAGPGAGDDGSGVATILETLRAWKARGLPSRHPVIVLFTDGEEYGMLGAQAFVHNPYWSRRVGIVINMEGRGSTGRSLLFQTSSGNAKLIDLYARHAPRYASSSLFPEIYRIMPNDTDLTPFLREGVTGYNFAFVGGVQNYHTPNDTVANLDPRTLQSHGDNLLALLDALAMTRFEDLKGGDAAFLDILGVWLPRLPSGWMLPLSLLVFGAIAVCGWRARDPRAPRWQHVRAGLMPPLLVLCCAAIGFALHFIASLLSGAGDPSFAHPWALRLGLAFGLWAVLLLTVRLGVSAAASWLWLAGLGVVTAIFLTGLSPFFVFPALVAAVVFPFVPRRPWLLAAPALAAALIWLGLAVQGEELLGLMGHPLFTVTAAFALVALAPLLSELDRRAWIASAGASTALALLFAVIAGFLPPYSAQKPQRINLRYVEREGRALWAADPARPFPSALRAAANFSATPQPLVLGSARIADAGRARFPAPSAEVIRMGRNLAVTLQGSPDAEGMTLVIPRKAGLNSAVLGKWKFKPEPGGDFRISCMSPGCRNAMMVLGVSATEAFDITVVEMRRGLPPGGETLIAARAPAVPSQTGDITMLAAKVAVPRR